VVLAADGQEAIERTNAERIDLLLLDLNLPGNSGWDVFGTLTSLNPFLPIIIITGYGDEESADECFFGVIATDGAGSPREGMYKKFTDDEMKIVRKKEQKKAAVVGEYGAVAFLNYTSSEIKNSGNPNPKDDLRELLLLARPKYLYTHNPADKHDTHVAVGLRAIQAVRELPPEMRPEKIYGCEVWRDLDWLSDEDKVGLDVSEHQNLATSLVSVHDSQVSGGKGYDLATIGRRRAHATYYATHDVDVATSMIFAMDLTPLAQDPSLSIRDFVSRAIARFAADVTKRIDKLL